MFFWNRYFATEQMYRSQKADTNRETITLYIIPPRLVLLVLARNPGPYCGARGGGAKSKLKAFAEVVRRLLIRRHVLMERLMHH